MKPIKQTLLSSAIILALSTMFTSCEDILGEWDKPAQAVVTPSEPETPSKTSGTISFAESSFLKGSKDPVVTFTNPLTLTGDGTVSYESSNTAVATVDAMGKVTIAGPGTTTIKAKVSDTDAYTYTTNEASYTIEVKSGYSFKKWDKDLATLILTRDRFLDKPSGIITNPHPGFTIRMGITDRRYLSFF